MVIHTYINLYTLYMQFSHITKSLAGVYVHSRHDNLNESDNISWFYITANLVHPFITKIT